MTKPRSRKSSKASRGGGRAAGRRRSPAVPARPTRSSVLADARAFALLPTRSTSRSSEARRNRGHAAGFRSRSRGPTLPGLPAVVRGASSGFSVLVVGELLGIIFLRGAAVGVMVTFVGLAGFAFAGNRAGAVSPGQLKQACRDGSLAAVGAWLLTVPLRITAGNPPSWRLGAVELGFAAAVGGLAGIIVARAIRSGPKRETQRG